MTDQKVWCVVEVNQTKVLQQTTRSHDSTCVHLTDGVSKLSLKQHILWVNAALLFLHLVYNFSKAKTFFGTLTAKLKYILIYSTKYFMQVHLHRPICYNPEAHRNVWSFLQFGWVTLRPQRDRSRIPESWSIFRYFLFLLFAFANY